MGDQSGKVIVSNELDSPYLPCIAMAACEPLVLGSHVLDKYRACKLEFNFDKGLDEVFLDFLLDTSVKVIDIS